MSKDKGTTDESIGRPVQWREGRYQQAGQSVEESAAPDEPLDAKNPSAASGKAKITPGPKSTAVHLDEYTQRTPGSR
jgi:hypothetical protein